MNKLPKHLLDTRRGRWDRIVELYQTGLSSAEVAKIMGITRQGVSWVLKKRGVEIRGRGGSNGGGRR